MGAYFGEFFLEREIRRRSRSSRRRHEERGWSITDRLDGTLSISSLLMTLGIDSELEVSAESQTCESAPRCFPCDRDTSLQGP